MANNQLYLIGPIKWAWQVVLTDDALWEPRYIAGPVEASIAQWSIQDYKGLVIQTLDDIYADTAACYDRLHCPSEDYYPLGAHNKQMWRVREEHIPAMREYVESPRRKLPAATRDRDREILLWFSSLLAGLHAPPPIPAVLGRERPDFVFAITGCQLERQERRLPLL